MSPTLAHGRLSGWGVLYNNLSLNGFKVVPLIHLDTTWLKGLCFQFSNFSKFSRPP